MKRIIIFLIILISNASIAFASNFPKDTNRWLILYVAPDFSRSLFLDSRNFKTYTGNLYHPICLIADSWFWEANDTKTKNQAYNIHHFEYDLDCNTYKILYTAEYIDGKCVKSYGNNNPAKSEIIVPGSIAEKIFDRIKNYTNIKRRAGGIS